MMRARRSALAAMLLGAVLVQAWPLEVSQGRLKLVLHEGMGRFSLYLDGTALFADQDPRTSGISLLLGNRVVKLGESAEFRETAESLPAGARFTWRSKRALVTATFSFQGSSGLALTIAVTNETERELSVGLRLLLDTNLGEAGFPHFRTERTAEINSEVVFERQNMPEYWLSRSSRAAGSPGLQGYLRGQGVTTPNRVVLANWRRLSEAAWSYQTTPARNFSDLPYSINDSAVGQYYDPAALPAGGSRTVVVLLVASSEEPEGVLMPELAGAGMPSEQQELSIQGDLRVLDGLLQQVDRKLASTAPPSEEELRLMEQMLSDLKNRLERYGE